MSDLLETAPHEFDANLLFTHRDVPTHAELRMFYAFEHVIRNAGGSKRVTASFDGQPVNATLYYQDSGIGALNHPSSQLDTIREYRLTWEFDDEIGERSGSYHIAPRTPDMEDLDGDPISTPDVVGVNVRAQGSNLEFSHYPPLFRTLCRALDIDPEYFAEDYIHEYSNIQDAERYVRIDRTESGPLHAVDGAIARVSNLLAGDRSGYRKHVADDTEAPGYYHTATIGPDRAGELVERHRLAKEIKHYLPREAEAFDPDHPLHHPKLGCSLQASRMESSPSWADLERVERELDEVVLNILAWEDYPISEDALQDDRADEEPAVCTDAPGPYVEDAYFHLDTQHRARRIGRDPTPELIDRQESLVMKHVVDGLADSSVATLEQLVVDGGHQAPKEIASETGYHLDTIYAAIDRLQDLVEHSYGSLELRSHYVAERVTQAIQAAQRGFDDALETAADALARADGLELSSDVLTEFLDEHGITVDDRQDGQLVLRAGDVHGKDLDTLLTLGRQLWRRAGWREDRWNNAELQFRRDGHRQIGRVRSFLPG